MATPGMGLEGSSQGSLTNLLEQKLRTENIVKGGASWFLWVAGLSLLNSVLSLSGAGFSIHLWSWYRSGSRRAGSSGR